MHYIVLSLIFSAQIIFGQNNIADTKIGNFNQIFDLKKTSYKDPVLVSSVNGLGSKLKIAQLMRNPDTIGADLVALCINNLITRGAEPIFLMHYLAATTLDIEHEVIKGIAQACIQNNCMLIGGQTAQIASMFNADGYDLAGFAVGIVEREKILPKKELIQQGDVLIGLSSHSAHANNYSWIYKIIESNHFDINGRPPFATYHQTFGATLLEPTIAYANCVLPLCKDNLIKAAAHLADGGFAETLSALLPDHLAAHIDIKTWYIPPLFRWFKYITHLSDAEMIQTCNCGIDIVLIADKKNSSTIIERSSSHGIKAHLIGAVENNLGGNKISISGTIPIHAMKTLVIGSGAREHAIAWKLAQSPYVGLVLVAPGNGGTSKEKKVRNIPINAQHTNALITYAKQQEIDLIIVGPEQIAANGFADECIKNGIRCLGPSKAATMIESKKFAKEFMARHKIPTILDGQAIGQEVTFCVISDGKSLIPLASSHLHKKHDAGDFGADTEGMGAYCPAPIITQSLQDQIVQTIIQPTIDGMRSEGNPFVGFLSTTLLIKNGIAYCLEYHCSLGDPEAQAILMRLKSDFFILCDAVIAQELDKLAIQWDQRPALSIMMVARDYPSQCKKGEVIVGTTEHDSSETKIFHAGTAYDNGRLITNGGRVLCATALGITLLQARNNAYDLIKNVYWPDAYYRTDIGYNALIGL